MTSLYKNVCLILCLLLIIPTAISAQSNEQRQSRELLLYYFDLVQSGNYESANGLWDQKTLDIVNRLGIKYDKVELKQEIDAPIVREYDQIKAELQFSLYTATELENNFFRWKQMAKLKSGQIDYYYYTESINGYDWLVLPITHYAGRWNESESKYFKFFVEPGMENQIGPVVYEELDNFVDSIASITSLSEEKLSFLEQKKIYYYLCLDNKMVEIFDGGRKSLAPTIGPPTPSFHRYRPIFSMLSN